MVNLWLTNSGGQIVVDLWWRNSGGLVVVVKVGGGVAGSWDAPRVVPRPSSDAMHPSFTLQDVAHRCSPLM